MTLCKFRPQRTYDAQFIIDQFDANGLLKVMEHFIDEMGEAGLASTVYYVGARLALETLFNVAEKNGEVDMWVDFMSAFESALQELEGC